MKHVSGYEKDWKWASIYRPEVDTKKEGKDI